MWSSYWLSMIFGAFPKILGSLVARAAITAGVTPAPPAGQSTSQVRSCCSARCVSSSPCPVVLLNRAGLVDRSCLLLSSTYLVGAPGDFPVRSIYCVRVALFQTRFVFLHSFALRNCNFQLNLYCWLSGKFSLGTRLFSQPLPDRTSK